MDTDVEEEIGKVRKSLLWMRAHWIAVVVGIVIGVACTSSLYETFRIDAVRDRFAVTEQSLLAQKEDSERREKYANEKLDVMEDFEKKYIEERTRAQILDKKVQELELDIEKAVKRYDTLLAMKWEEQYIEARTRSQILDKKVQELEFDVEKTVERYDALLTMKWEEKYNAEKLSRIAKEAELVSLQQRLTNAEENAKSGQATADPHLVRQIETLAEQNRILTTERDRLKELYTSVTSRPVGHTTPSQPRAVIQKKSTTPFPVEALTGVSRLDAGNTVVAIVASMGKPIEVSSFIAALEQVSILDRDSVVRKCAPSLGYPLTADQIKGISVLLSKLNAGDTMKVLMEEQAKH